LKEIVKTLAISVIILSLLLGVLLPSAQAAINQSTDNVFLGLSGYPTSTGQIDNIINTMKANGLNIYRMSANPQWSDGPHPYHPEYIQYFLDHTPSNWVIIVDRNHIYPPTETSASSARSNWDDVRNSIFEVLAKYPNNPRVMVELINEYVSSDFYQLMQGLVNEIRAAGYTNPIVVDKWNQPWTVIKDPLDTTYQGYHFYFNSWSVSGAISQMRTAQSKGIKIINTEVGADFNEYRSFTTSTVAELNDFLSQCANMGIGNTVWMNENLNNMPTYQSLDLVFPIVTSPQTSTNTQPSSTPSPTPTSSPNPTATPSPTPTSTPTPTPSPTTSYKYHRSHSTPTPTPSTTPSPTPSPTPTSGATTIIQDTFESNNLNTWAETTSPSSSTINTGNYNPYQGNYDVRFYTPGSSTARQNAYISKNVNLQTVTATGQFYFSSYPSGNIVTDSNDRLYLIRLATDRGDVAWAGLRRENGVTKWILYTNGAVTSTTISVNLDTYYNIQLQYNSDQQTATMYVNGQKILQSSTSNYGQVTHVDMGIISTYSVQNPLIVYGDNFIITAD
jgi:hypothetical protein